MQVLSPTCAAAAWIVATVVLTTAAAAPRTITSESDDGFELAATYFDPGKPGPGILLLHQCNADRSMWNELGAMLADAGFHVLALDYRGYGGSTSEEYDLAKAEGREQRDRIHAFADRDVAAAYRKLIGIPGVDAATIGTGGASCGGRRSLELASKVDGIRTMVFLSTGVDDESTAKLKNVPVLAITAEGDERATSSLRALFERSSRSESRLIVYKGAAHGAPLFEQDPRLRQTIADWYREHLR